MRFTRYSYTVGKLIISTMLQAQGAPIVDSATTHNEAGCVWKGWAIRPPFFRHRPVLALVVGWRRTPKVKLTLLERWRLWIRLTLGGLCPLCNDDAPEVDRCPVCCNRAGAKRGHVDWMPSGEEGAKIRARYLSYCLSGDYLPWDLELSGGMPPPAPMCSTIEGWTKTNA